MTFHNNLKLREKAILNIRSREILRLLLQIVVMVIIIVAFLWYVGISALLSTLSSIKIEYLMAAFLAYFGINLLFAVRLKRVLRREGVRASLGRTLLAQYAGMLTSDVTPGRSGYFLTPVYLMDQNVPTSVSLSGILGIQTIEFLFKVFGGILALVFLVGTASLSGPLFVVGVVGVVLMLAGAVFLAALSWSKRVISFFKRIARSRFLARFAGGLIEKLEEYKKSAVRTRKAIPEIALLTLSCWI